jgi:hypothetical protein
MKSHVRDGVRIDWDISIPSHDGSRFAADRFRPTTTGSIPCRPLRPRGQRGELPVGYETEGPADAGSLRVSQRKTDPERTLPSRPWNSHDAVEKLEPGPETRLILPIIQKRESD